MAYNGIVFRALNQSYYYDANRNTILRVENNLEKHLKQYLIVGDSYLDQGDDSDTQNQLKRFITKYRKKDFFMEPYIEMIEHPKLDLCESYIENDISSVLIQVTQQCNLRCRYCNYSGDGIFDRPHNNMRMSFDTAKKALDYAISHCKVKDNLSIGFYGGEPLLEISLIHDCVDYLESKGVKAYYSMTTNFTVVNDQVIDFLAKHRFLLTISLDGPEEITDALRRYRSNGKGVFSDVYQNVLKLKERYPSYFTDYVSFNAVIDPIHNYDFIADFFRNGELKDCTLTTSIIDTTKIDYIINTTNEYRTSWEKNLLQDYIYRYIYHDKYSDLTLTREDDSKFIKILKERQPLTKTFHHSGPCVAGSTRLFVTTDGNFYPCEKCSGLSKALRLGDVNEGININKVKELLNIGTLTKDECKSCWAIRFCSMCAVFCDDTYREQLSSKIKQKQCIFEKQKALDNIIEYITLNEACKLIGEIK